MTAFAWTRTGGREWRVTLNRRLSAEDARTLHVMNLLGVPRGHPHEKDIRYLVGYGCKASGIAAALWCRQETVEALRMRGD